MRPKLRFPATSIDLPKKYLRRGLWRRAIDGTLTTVGVMIGSVLALPLLLIYLAVVLLWFGCGLMSLVYLVGAVLAILVWLVEGGSDNLWHAARHFGSASLWFGLIVASSYAHSALADRLKRPRDESFHQ